MSIFNHDNTKQIKLKKINIGFLKKFSKYIFITFLKEFIIWFTSFFIILFAISYIDVHNELMFTQKIVYNLDKTLEKMLSSLNIILLITCISYFIKTKSSFNFHILQSFGIATRDILKPILIFISIFGIVNIFCLKPLSIYLENARRIMTDKYLQQQTIKLKKNTKFTITDGIDNKDYIIISGNFLDNNSTTLYINNAVFLEYKQMKLSKIYSVKNAFLQDKIWQLDNLSMTILQENNTNTKNIKHFSLNSQFYVKELVRNIENASKIEKSVFLGLYDFLKMEKHKHKTKTINDVSVKSRLYFYEEITNFINSILCCFMAFLFCFSGSRNTKIVKTTLKCFIIYFIFLRIFHSLEGIVKISSQATLLIYILDILLCIIVYSFIIEKEKNSNKYFDIKCIKNIIINYFLSNKKNKQTLI